MSLLRYYARTSADAQIIALVATELASRWDPQQEFSSPDGTRAPESHARAILGILSTGADFAAVRGYLRRAEEAALGEARSDGTLRHELAQSIWRRMVDAAVAAAREAGEDEAAT